MLEQKWQNSLFATQKQENDWVYTPNQGALRCVPPLPPSLSRLAGYALAPVASPARDEGPYERGPGDGPAVLICRCNRNSEKKWPQCPRTGALVPAPPPLPSKQASTALVPPPLPSKQASTAPVPPPLPALAFAARDSRVPPPLPSKQASTAPVRHRAPPLPAPASDLALQRAIRVCHHRCQASKHPQRRYRHRYQRLHLQRAIRVCHHRCQASRHPQGAGTAPPPLSAPVSAVQRPMPAPASTPSRATRYSGSASFSTAPILYFPTKK
jgi:hypothetical protein